MGLDMYLERRIYFGTRRDWGEESEPERGNLRLEKAFNPIDVNLDNAKEIILEVGYWRKANAIHRWFVVNVQNGADDCGEYYVPTEKLEELLALCKRAKMCIDSGEELDGLVQNGSKMKDGVWEPIMEQGKVFTGAEKAGEILPTAEGFFFGSTNYDQWYVQDIEDTIEILEEALKEKGNGIFYYSSSW